LDTQLIISRVLNVIILLLSLTVHEFAHAWSAWLLGDDTAERQGRLSLNPLVHADMIGTLALPLLGIPFGWAKPVPVDPTRFRRSIRMTTGMMITAAAGPFANVVLAVGSTVTFGLLQRFSPETVATGTAAAALLVLLIQANVTLALFNLLPIPPLDGSRIVDGLLPLRFQPQWQAIHRFAPLFLLGVIYFGGRIIAGPSDYALGLLEQLVRAIGA